MSERSGSILGNRVVRTEDPALLTVGGTYVDDIRHPLLDGAAYLTYVRSPVAHAKITSVDIEAAATAPGVVAVVTAADVDLAPMPLDSGMLSTAMRRPWLASDVVRFVGEPVAAVVTEERYQGADAAELVEVEYEPLEVVIQVEDSLRNEVLLHPGAGTNVAFQLGEETGDELFDGCEVIISQRTVNQRLAPCPLEVRSAAAAWDGDGRLVHWASCQGAHSVQTALAEAFAIEPSQIRVITPDVGGGFGAKGFPYPEELMVGWVARHVGRPVRWTETRSESMLGMGHGRAQFQHVELGGTKDGRIQAYRLTLVQDAGAYAQIGVLLPFMTRMMVSGVYSIPKVAFHARALMTNTTPVTAYRGAGRPEAAAAIERAVDRFAAEIGIDPAVVRSRNFVASDAFPHTTPVGTIYDSGDYSGALDTLLEAAKYEALRAEQARRRSAGETHRLLGLGLSVYVEVTNPMGSGEFAGVEVRADGTALVRTGTSSHGQGHHTAFAMLTADRLGIPMESIEVVHGDTDLIPRGGGTGGSRSLQVGGSAVHAASLEVADQARKLAAELLEASPDDVVLDSSNGHFHVTGTPAVFRTWSEVASSSPDGVSAELDIDAVGATYPFGAHLAVVEVDAETGKVTLVRLVALDDAGRIINPLLVEGQVHGGLAQGAAQAMLEEFVYDEEGNPLTSNLADYGFISAVELPSFETLHSETPTPMNPLGAKGIGESGSIGSTPAVQNAVVDAVAHMGVRHIDMPCTAERVWRAVAAAGE